MYRKIVSLVVVVLFVGVAMAEVKTGQITKVDGKKITFQETGKFDKATKTAEKTGTPVVLDATDDKITSGKFDPDTKKLVAGEDLTGGLTNEIFKNVNDDKGAVRATVDVVYGKAKSIIISARK